MRLVALTSFENYVRGSIITAEEEVKRLFHHHNVVAIPDLPDEQHELLVDAPQDQHELPINELPATSN